jgi:hypothetical protein
MSRGKMFMIFGCCVLACFLFARVASAQIQTNVWVDCALHIIQTGIEGGEEDTRLYLSARNGAFTNTWLIVDRSAAKMVAATALTAYSLGNDIRVRIVPYGTGYRVNAVRILP